MEDECKIDRNFADLYVKEKNSCDEENGEDESLFVKNLSIKLAWNDFSRTKAFIDLKLSLCYNKFINIQGKFANFM